MKNPLPKGVTPGARSVMGSSVTPAAFPKQSMELGELTPPGLVSHPRGASNVEYANGASTPASAAFNTANVGMVPLKES